MSYQSTTPPNQPNATATSIHSSTGGTPASRSPWEIQYVAEPGGPASAPALPQGGDAGSSPRGLQPPPARLPIARNIGLFGKVPCPYCGTPTSGLSNKESMNIMNAAGAYGWLAARAVDHKFRCPHHGEIPLQAFPPQHRRMLSLRRFVLVMGALSVFLFLWLLMLPVE